MGTRKNRTDISARTARMIRSAWLDFGTPTHDLARHYRTSPDIVTMILQGKLHPDATWKGVYEKHLKDQKKYHDEKKRRKCNTPEELDAARRRYADRVEDSSLYEDGWRMDQGSSNW